MKVFVFAIKRERDSEPWATVFTDKQRAEEYPDRASEVVEVELPMLIAQEFARRFGR